jgi:hypothetical protein
MKESRLNVMRQVHRHEHTIFTRIVQCNHVASHALVLDRRGNGCCTHVRHTTSTYCLAPLYPIDRSWREMLQRPPTRIELRSEDIEEVC